MIEDEIGFFRGKIPKVTILSSHWTASTTSPPRAQGINAIQIARYRARGPIRGVIRTIVDSIRISLQLRKLKPQPSVIHCHDPLTALSSILAGNSKKTVFHMHSPPSMDMFTMGYEILNEKCIKSLILRVENLLERIIDAVVVNSVRFVICVSEFELTYARRHSLRRIGLSVIRNGVDTQKFRFDPAIRTHWRQKLSIPDDAKVVLFLGDMVPKNGALILVDAILRYTASNPHRVYLLVGDGVERPEIERRLVASFRDDILILPPIPAEVVMPCADIFVSHLSSLVEGFGLTILEALACGLTVVTGMDRLKSAVFEQSEAIIFVQKDDSEAVGKAINRFATQSRRTSKYAVKLASEFSIEKSMRSLEKILLACSASPSRRGLSQLSAC